MKMERILSIFILLIFHSMSVVVCYTIIEVPVHTAALVGDQVRFNYSAVYTQGTDSIKWGFYDESSGSPTLRTIYTTAQGITPDAAPYFDVDDSIPDQYDLIMLNAEEKLAGRYYAGFAINDAVKIEPELVVLTEPTCSPPPGTEPDGNYVLFICTLQYKGYKRPRMRWFNEYEEEIDSAMHIDETNTVRLFANMTATDEINGHVMTCKVDFTQDDGEPYPAPTFEHQCQTYYDMFYHPTKIDINPNSDNGTLTMYEGEQINCTANGNPDPDYRWYCDGAYHSEGQILYMEGDLIKGSSLLNACNCTARNMIDGVSAGWFKTVKFYAYPQATSQNSQAAVAGVISAALIIPLLVVGTVLGLGLYRRFTTY